MRSLLYFSGCSFGRLLSGIMQTCFAEPVGKEGAGVDSGFVMLASTDTYREERPVRLIAIDEIEEWWKALTEYPRLLDQVIGVRDRTLFSATARHSERDFQERLRIFSRQAGKSQIIRSWSHTGLYNSYFGPEKPLLPAPATPKRVRLK